MKITPVKGVLLPNFSSVYMKNSLYLFADKLRSMRNRPSHEAIFSAMKDGGNAARNAAEGIARILQQVQQLQNSAVETARTAARLTADADSNRLLGSMQQLADDYNRLNESINEHDSHLNDAVKNLVKRALTDIPADEIGFARTADDSLAVQESGQLAGMLGRTDGRRSFAHRANGIAADFRQSVSALLQLPAEALLDKSSPSLRRYALYKPDKLRYLQIPNHGMVLDIIF